MLVAIIRIVLLNVSNMNYIADEDLQVETSRISKFMLLMLNKTLFSNICMYVYTCTVYTCMFLFVCIQAWQVLGHMSVYLVQHQSYPESHVKTEAAPGEGVQLMV